nr:hypothetical protein [Acinetobacter sp. Marseille-Q1620]
MKLLKILIIVSVSLIAGCSQAKNANSVTEEEFNKDVERAREASLYAQFNQLNYTKYIFKAAYAEANKTSKTSDQLLQFAGFQTHSLQTIYSTLNLDLEQDIENLIAGKKSKVTPQALDALCINNKFIEKYSKITDLSKSSETVKEFSESSLKLQPKILKVLEKEDNSLKDLICTSLK